MEVLAIIAAVAPAVASVIGYLVEQGKVDEANAIINKAQNDYNALDAPALQKATFDILGKTELSKIVADPKFKEAQDQTLSRLKQISDGGGLTAEDRAQLSTIHNQTARQASNRQSQIVEDMNARGVGGSGAELAMRQANAQDEANRANQGGLDVAAGAQKRAYQAMMDRGQMATAMRGQDWNEKAQTASAQDAINKFNKQFELDQQKYNNGIDQQRFTNNAYLADKHYGMAQDKAGRVLDQGRREREAIETVGQGVSDGASAGAGVPKAPGGGTGPSGGSTALTGSVGASLGGPQHRQTSPYGGSAPGDYDYSAFDDYTRPV
jgi:hypothetical protein